MITSILAAIEKNNLEEFISAIAQLRTEQLTAPFKIRQHEYTYLHYAAEKNADKIVIYLLKLGIFSNEPCGSTKQTPLMVAAKNGSALAIVVLLQHLSTDAEKINAITQRDLNNDSALFLAVINNHPEVLVALLIPGIDVNVMKENKLLLIITAEQWLSSNNFPPVLNFSKEKEQFEIIRILITAGAKLEGPKKYIEEKLLQEKKFSQILLQIKSIFDAAEEFAEILTTRKINSFKDVCFRDYQLVYMLLEKSLTQNPNDTFLNSLSEQLVEFYKSHIINYVMAINLAFSEDFPPSKIINFVIPYALRSSKSNIEIKEIFPRICFEIACRNNYSATMSSLHPSLLQAQNNSLYQDFLKISQKIYTLEINPPTKVKNILSYSEGFFIAPQETGAKKSLENSSQQPLVLTKQSTTNKTIDNESKSLKYLNFI